MNRIYFIRILDENEMDNIINTINSIINNNIKLIIIDSICYYYRKQMQDIIKRTHKISKIGENLHEICSKYNITIITTNHLTARINNSFDLIPTLGETWNQQVNIRIKMFTIDQNKFIISIKGETQHNPINYTITENGIICIN